MLRSFSRGISKVFRASKSIHLAPIHARAILSLSVVPKHFFSNKLTLEPIPAGMGMSNDVVFANPEEYVPRSVLKDIVVPGDKIKLTDLAAKMDVPVESLMESMTGKGGADKAEKIISRQQAEFLALERGFRLLAKKIKREALPLRPPIITIMGHVDHGKTTLLDALRDSNVVAGEFGGITQKIGAFSVRTEDGKKITVIDTPGHEAFTNMRQRGAQSTDLVILVVSAADGIQPQTLESLRIATAAKVPIIVAINKIDVPGADPEEIEIQLKDNGVSIEPFDGNIPVVHISAKTGKNVNLLEELILFQAELMDLREEIDCEAQGFVLEARKTSNVDSKNCTVVVRKGTLKANDIIVCGNTYGRVRGMRNDRNKNLKEISAGYAVEITGLKELPETGDSFVVVPTEALAKHLIAKGTLRPKSNLSDEEDENIIMKDTVKVKFAHKREKRLFYSGNMTFILQKFEESAAEKQAEYDKLAALAERLPEQEQLMQSLKKDLDEHKKYIEEIVKESASGKNVNIILKTLDKGTLDALLAQIEKMTKDNDKLRILDCSVGEINNGDLKRAKRFNATIITMDIEPTPEIQAMAFEESISIKPYKIIYGILEQLKRMMEMAPVEATPAPNTTTAQGGNTATTGTQANTSPVRFVKKDVKIIGSGSVREVFDVKIGKVIKSVAGTMVRTGTLNKKFKYRLVREGEVIAKDLSLANLKKFKTEVSEIKKGEECGVSFVQNVDIRPGDVIEGYDN